MFALFMAPASSVFRLPQAGYPYSYIQSITAVLFWLWGNLLPFNIGNQSHPDSIAEDAISKPWCMLPSKCMTLDQARVLVRIFCPIAVAVNSRGCRLGSIAPLSPLASVIISSMARTAAAEPVI